MYDFFIQTVMVASLTLIVYLFARALPRMSVDGTTPEVGSFDKFLARVPVSRIDIFLHEFFEKTLRRSKFVVMKTDNLINGYLGRMKQHAAMKDKQANLKEKMEAMVGEMKDDDNQKPA